MTTPDTDPADRSGSPPESAPPAEVPVRTYRRRRGRPPKARGQPNSSDAATARWTIRGVPTHVRDMAVRGAEGRSMTVGDWVAEAIIAKARSQPAPGPAQLPATEAEAPPNLAALIERLDARLSRLEEKDNRPGFFGRLFGRRG